MNIRKLKRIKFDHDLKILKYNYFIKLFFYRILIYKNFVFNL
jgi:hypothetical protein